MADQGTYGEVTYGDSAEQGTYGDYGGPDAVGYVCIMTWHCMLRREGCGVGTKESTTMRLEGGIVWVGSQRGYGGQLKGLLARAQSSISKIKEEHRCSTNKTGGE